MEAQRQIDLAAHGMGNDVGDARRRFVEPEQQLLRPGRLTGPGDRARQRRYTGSGGDALPYLGSRETEGRRQLSPRPLLPLWRHAHHLERPPSLAAEVLEIEPQDAEEGQPAVRVSLELLVPGVAAAEPAVHHAHHALSAVARLDAPLRSHRRIIGAHVVPALGHET